MKVPEPKKLPSGNWFIRLRLGGENIPITRTTYKECKRDAETIKAEYLSGRRLSWNVTTLDNAIKQYINKRNSVLSPSTIAGYRTMQRNYFNGILDAPIDNIDWQRHINGMARKYSPKTVKNTWRFVSSVLKESGVEREITLPQQEVKEHKYLSSDEIKVFVNALDGEPVQIPALLGLHSLRKSEIIALDWKDIDLKSKTIHVHSADVVDENGKLTHKKTTKNATSTRDVPIIIPSLYSALCAVEDKTGKVCTMYHSSIYKAINRICEQNGLPLVGVHGLRHSFASLAIAYLQIPIESVEKIGGWKKNSQALKEIYEHTENKVHQQSRQRLEQFFKK